MTRSRDPRGADHVEPRVPLFPEVRDAGADEGDEWPLPLPKGPSEEDVFRLPEKPRRPNPFGDD